MTQTEKARRERARHAERVETDKPWNVILHNDWRNPINRVVWRLYRTVPGMTLKMATRITWEAHSTGQAVAKTCHRELAELYEERLKNKGLTVSLEPT